ncbi:MAG: hypothetical protein HRT44_04680 [Bdellovibrionales bacterium]|nr:hypothetical protein [Bdellovibrionales bacterium]NQZ18538.1 hypothetical protein [Bdellovibrionales bacterium]
MAENDCCVRSPYFEFLEKVFPKSLPEINEKKLISEYLFSPFVLDLPAELLNQAQDFVTEVYKIKDSKEYQDLLPQNDILEKAPNTPSVLSCFDFHYTEEMGLKLIEVNTNASLYLPLIIQSCAQGDQCADPTFDQLRESFEKAFNLKEGDEISILDEVPENEGLFFEFLIFKEWFERLGYKANIIGLADYSENKYKNIYNRFTDFYLSEEKSKELNDDYYSGKIQFSPNPREYFLMADKKRQMAIRSLLPENMKTIIPESKLFSEFESKAQLWSERKKYFFKPSQSFGSKGVFSGKGISKKAFEGIYAPDFMAQELAPAGKRKFQHEDQEVEMKFDLRFFTFDGLIQNYGARIYQGQTTNMRTPLGGITPIRFN